MLTLIGDVHGLFIEYGELLEETRGVSAQLGDMGLGFGRDHLFPVNRDAYFIRGNHDDPSVCRSYEGYLGEWGVFDKVDLGKSVFFVSGAWSIDREFRTEGRDWWRDEELGYMEFERACSTYADTEPDIVLSHDCPVKAFENMAAGVRPVNTRTGSALQHMFDSHRPELWVFAHHHVSMAFDLDGTHFVALGELETYEIV